MALDAARVRFEDGWHDVKAGVVFWAEPQREGAEMAGGKAAAQSCLAETGPMEQAGARLYREAVARGIDPAEELVVCLGDGAPANWSQFGLHFPNRVEVLDWYHAVEHLWAAARGPMGRGQRPGGGLDGSPQGGIVGRRSGGGADGLESGERGIRDPLLRDQPASNALR